MIGNEQDIGRKISRLQNKIRRELDESVAQNGIPGSQGRALIYLLSRYQEGETTYQKDLEERYSIRPATASKMLKQMVNDDLITRVPDPNDSRLKQLVPTDKAQSHAGELLQDLQALESKMSQNISNQHMKIFLQVLDQIEENLS